ncbi:hypothetical protein [Blastopirellula marina]|uniref:Uncharacterized protein n=1 Tax=Blastopirellula marina TaxID=124 RepID=A0A2S8FHQ4_9BACT|nr:hypothetical protein [Blastopirellula marina]PQO31687.1 hypothetical protein C5Y98_19940 [Blastopirellula marina]PTL42994.1 hypothetical protein C5Y97_19950 [Blastopirellula marina]
MDYSTRNTAGVVLVGVILVGIIAWWLTRPSYGEISEKGYDYAMALFSACNGKSTAKVEKIVDMIRQSAAAGELSQQEATWLQGIASNALEGKWDSANAAVRTLMEEQARQADPLPEID